MKKYIYYFAVFAIVLISACTSGEKGEKAPEKINYESTLTAEQLFTVEEAKSLVSYEPVTSSENTRQKSILRFDSDPIGQDPIIVELYAFNGARSIASVYEEFKQKKEKRPKAEPVEDFGAEAYIAYPSINLYRDGYMIVVTAGSGADEAQKELLINAGRIAVGHLNEYLEKYPTNSDLLDK